LEFQRVFYSILEHLRKVDTTIIDLKDASKAQIKQIKEFVSTLTKEQQKKIEYVK
jgi:ADP-heptose:LPS heptosyltransferase